MLPKMHITPVNQWPICNSSAQKSSSHIPTNSRSTHMEQDLAPARLGTWFFDEMDLMSRIVEYRNIDINRWCVIWPEDTKRGVIEDLARIIDVCKTTVRHYNKTGVKFVDQRSLVWTLYPRGRRCRTSTVSRQRIHGASVRDDHRLDR